MTKFKAESCRNINQHTKSVVQQVGVTVYIRNVVAPKMNNFKFTNAQQAQEKTMKKMAWHKIF